MSSLTKKRLGNAIAQFSTDVRAVSQQWDEGVASLKRAVDHGVSAGPHEFKDALADLEEDVASITLQLEQLEQHTTQAISVVELLGHCTGLYRSNRQGVLRLESHLRQYGYQPQGELMQPEDPLAAASVPGVGQAAQPVAEGEGDDLRVRPDKTGAGVHLGGRVAPNTPHYAMSQEAKARLRGRVKTPGISLAQLRHMDSSEDDAEYDGDQGRGGRYGKAQDNDDDDRDDDLAVRRRLQQAVAQAGRTQQAPGQVLQCALTPGPPGPQDSWGDEEEEEEEVEREEEGGKIVTQARAAGNLAGGRAALATPAANLPATTPWGQPSVRGTTAVPRASPAGPSPESSESLTPDALLLSASFAALQAKYGGGGGEGGGEEEGEREARGAGRGFSAASLSLSNLNIAGHASDDNLDTLNASHPYAAVLARPVTQQLRSQGALAAPRPPAPTSARPAVPTSTLLANVTSFPPEEDTCSLYAQLIRSKEVPTSLVTANTRAAAGRAASVGGATAAAAATWGRAYESSKFSTGSLGMSSNGSYGVRASVDAGMGAVAGTPPRLSPSPRCRSAPRSSARERAQAAQALEEKLNDLEAKWETSGQAALTPRRAAAAEAAAVLPAGRTGCSPARFTDLGTEPAAANWQHKPVLATGSQGFEFPKVLAAGTDSAVLNGQKIMQAAPAWLQQKNHTSTHGSESTMTQVSSTTPTLDAQNLGIYGGVGSGSTPSLLHAGHGLSPGTASLLHRVYGGSGGDGNGQTAEGVAVAATAARPTGAAALKTTKLLSPAAARTHARASIDAPSMHASAGHSAGNAKLQSPAAPRAVTESEFTALPSFLRSQLSLAQLNTALKAMPTLAVGGGGAAAGLTLTLEGVQEGLGYAPQQAKVLVNCLVKLGRATMQGGARFNVRV